MAKEMITLVELASHTDDIWVAFQGKVYDMKKFSGEHPGGADLVGSGLPTPTFRRSGSNCGWAVLLHSMSPKRCEC